MRLRNELRRLLEQPTKSIEEIVADAVMEDLLDQPGVREEIELEWQAMLYGDGTSKRRGAINRKVKK